MADNTTTVVRRDKAQANPSVEYSDHERDNEVKPALKPREFNNSFSDDDDSSDMPKRK